MVKSMLVSSPGGNMRSEFACDDASIKIRGSLIVMKAQGVDVIPGMNWLQRYNGVISCAERKVTLTTPAGENMEVPIDPPQAGVNAIDATALGEHRVVSNFRMSSRIRCRVCHPNYTGTAPIYKKAYRISGVELLEVKKQIDELLEKGFIRKSTSPWASPALLTEKKDGTLRMCVDYRGLNAVTVKNKYPPPRIEDLFDQLKGARVFSKIDLRSGYHQLRIDLRIYQRRRSLVVMGCMNIRGTRRASKISVAKLREHKLYAKFSKCDFWIEEVKFLGHVISNGGIAVDQSKVSEVQNWKIPEDVKGIGSFLGLAGYYRRFIEGFSKIAKPMTALLEKNIKFRWTSAVESLRGVEKEVNHGTGANFSGYA
ncbi:hypothetical protein U9M48_002945 [Paspalum notatum var. saurae]|uniref:Reverse transcriptase domain-containing protein n=1 Tax=Paspalum notatum var. saurae TaxID=547442 RepID=A0AAQ3SJI3_PASNO